MSRRVITACLCLAAIGGAAAAATANGQATGRTLHFTAKAPAARDAGAVDVKPRGTSAGDEFLGAQTLRSGGKVVGRVHAVCTIVDISYHGQDCRITLILRDGQIAAQGGGLDKRLPGVGDGSAPGGDPFAVTGGTGAYAGAGGTLLIGEGKRGGSKFTVSLTG